MLALTFVRQPGLAAVVAALRTSVRRPAAPPRRHRRYVERVWWPA